MNKQPVWKKHWQSQKMKLVNGSRSSDAVLLPCTDKHYCMRVHSRFEYIKNIKFKFRKVLRCSCQLPSSIVSHPAPIEALCDQDDEERVALKLQRSASLTDWLDPCVTLLEFISVRVWSVERKREKKSFRWIADDERESEGEKNVTLTFWHKPPGLRQSLHAGGRIANILIWATFN